MFQGQPLLEDWLLKITLQMKQLNTPCEYAELNTWKVALECAIEHIIKQQENHYGFRLSTSNIGSFSSVNHFKAGGTHENNGSSRQYGPSSISEAKQRLATINSTAKHNTKSNIRCTKRTIRPNVAKHLANIALSVAEEGSTDNVRSILMPFLYAEGQSEEEIFHKRVAQIIYAISLCRHSHFLQARKLLINDSSELGKFFLAFIGIAEHHSEEAELKLCSIANLIKSNLLDTQPT
ncbi:hypothetical protein [Vibrio zhanjiangensis]|nr:hypothetical protein [Vibrio zhanjiangensis]